MKTFSERLQELMKQTGLTNANLAKLLDVSEQRAENILTGYSNPDIGILKRVARIFNVSEKYVAGMSEDSRVIEPEFAREVYVATNVRDMDGIVTLKDTIGTAYMNIDEMHGKEYFALVAKDDSMVKSRIMPGDILMVRKQNYADNGDAVIVKVNDEDWIVRRYNRIGNIVTLTPDGDVMKHKVIKIDTTETKLIILGKVCQVRFNEI